MRTLTSDNVNIVLLHRANGRQPGCDCEMFPLMLRSEPFRSFVLGSLADGRSFRKGRVIVAIPKEWAVGKTGRGPEIVCYEQQLTLSDGGVGLLGEDCWVDISDGRFFTEQDNKLIYRILADNRADLVMVNVVAQLRASYEKVLTTSQNGLVGFRLLYEDAVQPVPIPDDWPHHLFIRLSKLDQLAPGGTIPLSFGDLVGLCLSRSLEIHSVNIGGSAIDLAGESGLLDLMRTGFSPRSKVWRYCAEFSSVKLNGRGISKAGSARLFGQVLLGEGVHISEDAIVVGPAIIGDDAKIGVGAVVRSSVIGPSVSVQAGSLIEERIVANSVGAANGPGIMMGQAVGVNGLCGDDLYGSSFREWPVFSYARFFKRIVDIVVATVVLILFAPVLPLIALAVKLTSPGPVFFRDWRQGMHGRMFKCLKFRTMQVGADKIQDELRVLNQADGPQFMIPDDPRMSAVGRFLRETYIDEIPQFINVLAGQMSVVGPRPSPESENRLCPFWRDARLSVRPGITGLWQVCRTRQRMKDFQEWIYYDIKYVRNLSLGIDLWICWKTAKRMLKGFVKQF